MPGRVELVQFPARDGDEGKTFSSRSVMYLEKVKEASGVRRVHSWTGPAAIEHYLDAEEKGRLIQSLKSYLPSRSLTGTGIFGRQYKFEDLVGRILSDLREQRGAAVWAADTACDGGTAGAVCGRGDGGG